MRINASLIGVKQRSRFDSSVQLIERLDPQCQCLLFADDASHNLGSTQVLHERSVTPMPVRCRQISHVANKLLPWRIGMEFTVQKVSRQPCVNNLVDIAEPIALLADDGIEFVGLHDTPDTFVIDRNALSTQFGSHSINPICIPFAILNGLNFLS